MASALQLLCSVLIAALVACSAPRPSAGSVEPEPAPAPPQPSAAPAAPVPAAAPEAVGPDAPPDSSGWGVAAGLKYLEIVRGEASADEPLPMVIVIHGLGDRPHRGWLYAIDIDPKVKARMILPQAPLPYGQGFAWFPFRFQDRDEAALAGGISEAAARLTQMIDVLQTQRPSRGRVVVTGFSQGGMLSFALALTQPQKIQFALPISGELPKPLWPNARAQPGLPRVIALHGAADTVVSFEADAQLVQHLRGLGYPLELVRYEGVGHRITEDMSTRVKRELSAAVSALLAAKTH
jgi:phospholipase/carboxylesterase